MPFKRLPGWVRHEGYENYHSRVPREKITEFREVLMDERHKQLVQLIKTF